ncbi:MAG: hypothetical protein O3A84_02985, partial [Proteobacteria bacterium]|nr:hypothetical protein [Pseudomonadota bacterium]
MVLSQAYFAAMGEVIAQWAYYESEFDGAIAFMGMDPKAKKLVSKVPFSFNQRIKLFSDLAKICFDDCPPLL